MKKFILPIIGILFILIGGLLFYFSQDAANPYADVAWGRFAGNCEAEGRPADDYGKNIPACDLSVPDAEIPKFTEVPIEFSNEFDNKQSLPLMGSALIDIDNDGVDEVFFAGGVNQEDALFRYKEGKFVNITEAVKLPKKPSHLI